MFPRSISFPQRLTGLGALTGGAATAASIAATGASTTAGILVALGTIGGPVGAAIGGLISLGLVLANVFSGCGQTCVEASNIANQVESQALKPMLQTYMASPVHYASMQAAYLNNFDSAWNALTQACGNPQLSTAGKNCISDRQQGACTWKTSPGGWQQTGSGWQFIPYGAAGSGSTCWNWFVGYRDPVANDPTVVPDPSPISASGSGLDVYGVTIPPAFLLGGAALLLALLLL